MAMKKRPPEFLRRVADAARRYPSKAQAARSLGIPISTFRSALEEANAMFGSHESVPIGLPDPAIGVPSVDLPQPIHESYEPIIVDTPGHWGIISDVHLPYHDLNTIRKWADDCKKRGIAGVLLNGDILDCYQLSSHHKDPTKARFKQELDCGKQFLQWLRGQFPSQRIIYKEGNHDDRLRRYIAERAPALFDIEEIDLRVMLGLDDLGIEWVAEKRVINLGKLPVVHGHEFRGGGGVMPARWLYLRTGSTALCGHFHRTSEHHETTLDRRHHGVWSVGCACFLYPQYDPNNKWNNGYAIVEVFQDGHFSVTNRRILRDGQVV